MEIKEDLTRGELKMDFPKEARVKYASDIICQGVK